MVVLDSVDSTNSWVMAHAGELSHGEIVIARAQTSGRGQRGNSWEAEPGKNLTASLLLRPDGVDAVRQFDISRAVAVGVAGALQGHIRDYQVLIKWPNDIYVGDSKIAGILIENILSGRLITHSIVGIGVNLNQRVFVSDAPNPVSVFQLTGEEIEVEAFAMNMRDNILNALSLPVEELFHRYDSLLWRGKGAHEWADNLRHEIFSGEICGIAPTGHISIKDTNNRVRVFAFKEVSAVL